MKKELKNIGTLSNKSLKSTQMREVNHPSHLLIIHMFSDKLLKYPIGTIVDHFVQNLS